MSSIYSKYGSNSSKTMSVYSPVDNTQVKNSSGAYVWETSIWNQLDRFLLTGSESGTYYISEQKLTRDNAKNVEKCILQDGIRVLNRVKEFSVEGRAIKNEPCLFTLAMCISIGNTETKQYAEKLLIDIARTGTHLFSFVEYTKLFRGWGRILRRSISNWYNIKSDDSLVYQLIKYKSRNNWTHADVIKLSHVKSNTEIRDKIYKWVLTGNPTDAHELIEASEKIKTVSEKEAIDLINKYNLPREVVPTNMLNSIGIWDALLTKMPLTATIRNLGKMTNIGLITSGSKAEKLIVERLNDKEYLHKSRIHPFSVLVALKIYAQNHGDKGSLTWNSTSKVKDALDNAFYKSFKNITPTNKNIMLALDISDSMTWGDIAGLPLNAREVSAALALITKSVEPNAITVGFSNNIIDLDISSKRRLDDVIKYINGLPFGSTNPSLAVKYARDNKFPMDAMVVYTDNEVNQGTHISTELKNFRKNFNVTTKMIMVAMTANNFSMADPKDPLMLDISGFDSNTPMLIESFINS